MTARILLIATPSGLNNDRAIIEHTRIFSIAPFSIETPLLLIQGVARPVYYYCGLVARRYVWIERIVIIAYRRR